MECAAAQARGLTPVSLRPGGVDSGVVVCRGVTSYYDQLIVLQAGLCSEEEYLKDLANDLSRFLSTPGRQVQSLLESATKPG